MVKNVEICILCPGFACKLLYIVYDQHIYHLIEMHKVSQFVLDVHGIHELDLEQIGGNIQNHFVRDPFFDLNAYGLRQMCLAQTRAAVYEQGIEGTSWFFGNTQAGGACQPVACSFYKIIKGVSGIQLGVYLNLSYARYDIRTCYVFRVNPGKRDGFVLELSLSLVRHRHSLTA
jgi:hypothetical protein